MANKFQVKRTTVSGRTPNTTNSGNSHFIDTGELALNLTDGKMFSSNGTVYFEVGANLQNISIASNATFGSSGKIVANGSFGTAGQVLTSNGTTMYWSTVSGGGGSGTVTQVNTGIGLSGGPITTTGTISVVANDGIVANSTGLFANAGTGVVVNATGIHVNSSYIGTLAANSATYLGGNTALDLRNYSDTQSGTAYTNATAFAANATNISSGTLDAARLPASVVQNTDSRTLSGNLVISGTSFTPSSNTVQLGNSTQRWVLSANTGDFTGTVTGTVANMSTSVNSALLTVGTSFIANTIGVFHTGTVNAASHTTSGFVANTTVIAPTSNTILLGNSIGRFVISANTIDTSGLITGGAGATITGQVNASTGFGSGTINATSNGLFANATTISLGNSSVNVAITTAGITSSGGTGVNPSSNTVGTALGTTTQRWVVTANSISTSGSGSIGTTLAAGNTTVTGFVNASASVNSALLTVGTAFIANTTGAYHTGLVNAAAFNTSGFVANTTAIIPTSNTILLGDSIGRFVISANSINASGLITASAGANISGTANLVDVNISGNLTVSGTTTYVNTTNLNVGDNIVTLNADLTNVTAPTENAGLEVNRGSSANVSFLWNETSDSWTLGNTDITGYANATVSVNSALLTVGTSFIANTTGAYHTGTVNAASFTTTNFTANTTGAYPLSNSAGTALGSSTKRWIVTANTGDFTGTVTGTVANMSTSVNSALLTVGTAFIANATAVVITTPLTANGTTGTSGQVLTSNGTTGAPYWADSGGGGGAVGRTVTSYTGNGSTTSYAVNYVVGYLDVYLNGIRLILGTDFTATTGTGIVFTSAPSNGDNIDLIAYEQIDIAPVNARTVTNYTADGSTSTFSVTYDVGYLDVYVNGIRLSSGVDYTATNGSNVIFSTNPLNGDYIELVSLTVAPLATNGTIRTVTYYTGDGSTTDYGINYNNGYLDVYVNGIKYKYGEDYTASNGSGVSIISTPLAGDNIELVSYRNSANLSSYVSISGDTMTGALVVPVITSSGNVSGVNGYFTNINAASHTIGSTFIANTTGVYHTGTVNAASHTIGSSLIANTTGVYHTGTVNAASLTLGSSLIANTSGIYHTGVINAASLSIGSGSFSAHSTGVVITNPLTANGSTGTAGQVLASNGMSGSPYWTNPGTSVPNANTQVSSLGVGTPASGNTGEIRATDAITAYYSDRRLKENIKPIENAVEKVKQISGVTFTSNKVAEQYGYKNKNTQVGVIAQELELVLPQVVTAAPFDIGKKEDGTEYSLSGENYKTVYYEKIVPLLIEAIKEQQVKIEQLESSLDQLSKRV